MLKRAAQIFLTLILAISGTSLAVSPAYAFDVICPIEVGDGSCGGGSDPGGGAGGGYTTYTLQGAIENQGYETSGYGKRVKIRGYSRFADSSNNRVDADYINVRCYAYDMLGGYTTGYDSENNGALVDIKFASNYVYGVAGGGYRTITVTCSHYAEKNGVQYNATSNTQIDIP
ncbi:hypothetical protein ACIBCR_13715 [Micromonospora echinospora]|uniref:hypothetical protein n=1 Tax=Micromonospora echinospora TaxID=1877 RepID=UPI003790AA94